jgi:ABC-type branched-subunit amino acid transport system ATPase component
MHTPPLGGPTELRAENLSYWHGAYPVFSEVSFSILPHEFVGLGDDDGRGALAVAFILMGWAFPRSGALFFRDRPLNLPDDRRHIAFVGDHATEPLSRHADDYLYDIAVTGGVSRTEAIERVSTVLEAFSIQRRSRMSGSPPPDSDLFRVRLARSLLFKPSVVVLDARHAGLDSDALDTALQTLRNLPGFPVTAFVLNPSPSVSRLNRTLDIRKGRLVGTPAEGFLEARGFLIDCVSVPDGVRAFLARAKIKPEPLESGFRIAVPEPIAQECLSRLVLEGAHIRAVTPASLPQITDEEPVDTEGL